jgi:uncharacterized membrane protein YfcA
VNIPKQGGSRPCVVALFVVEHQVHTAQIWSTALLVPVFVLGAYVGERLGKRLPLRGRERLVTCLLLCSALVALMT